MQDSGISATPSDAAEKVVGIKGFTLRIGTRIAVMFTEANTADYPTLNVMALTPDAEIFYRGRRLTNTVPNKLNDHISVNRYHEYIWDGTRWQLLISATEGRGWTGVTTDPADIRDKDVFINGFTNEDRTVGQMLEVRFTEGNSSEPVYMNVERTGNAPLFVRDIDISPTLPDLPAMYDALVVWDGSSWWLINSVNAFAFILPDNIPRITNATWEQIGMVATWISMTGATDDQVRREIGWHIGDLTREFTAGGRSDNRLRIIGFNHDPLVDGGRRAGITFDFQHSFGSNANRRAGMEETDTNANGYHGSRMVMAPGSETLTTLPWIRSQLPEEIRNIMKRVRKPVATAGNQPGGNVIRHIETDIFLLSLVEVFGFNHSSHPGEGTQYAFYQANDGIKGIKIKQQAGTNFRWWLRSPFASDSRSFLNVNDGGGNTVAQASLDSGVSPALCI